MIFGNISYIRGENHIKSPTSSSRGYLYMKLLLLNRINCVRVRKKLDYNQCFVRDNR